MEEKSVDRRVRRTREQLRRALATLMREKELKDITVRELTELADVNRSTFYSHYQDVFDMARQVEQELFEQLDGVLSAYTPDQLRQDLSPVLLDVFTFVRDNSELCLVLMGQSSETDFFRRLTYLIHEKCLQEWQGIYPLKEREDLHYYLEFVVSGIVGMILSWGRAGCDRPPEAMAALAERIIVTGLPFQREE